MREPDLTEDRLGAECIEARDQIRAAYQELRDQVATWQMQVYPSREVWS